MHQIKVNNYVLESPASWNELTTEQLLYIAEYLDIWRLLVDSNINLGKSKALLLLKLLGTGENRIKLSSYRLLKPLFSKKTKAIQELISGANIEQLEQLIHLTDFVFEKNDLTINLLPYFDLNHSRYYGPSNACANLSFGEFVFAEELFKAFCLTSSEALLTLLVAVLYRPAKPNFNPAAADTDGDIRENFNKANLEFRAKSLESLPEAHKKSVMLIYMAFREKMVADNPEIFPVEEDNEEEGSKQKKQNSNNANWADVLIKMARSKRMDDEVLERKRLSTILMELKQIANENKQLQNKQKWDKFLPS